LQVRTNFAAFWEASASITPPRYHGWFAMTPTARPSIRQKAVTMFRAQRSDTSRSSSLSTSARITLRTS
jgi:hypothetical protein